ncbi:heme A synthase [Bradyrhizobium sp. USDA 3051]|jgi:heme A synthase
MVRTSARPTSYGLWVLLSSSLAGCIVAGIATFDQGNGIAHSGGAYLVLVTTLLLAAASLFLALYQHKRKWLRVVLAVLVLFDLLGTAFAAYFLETPILVGSMALGLVGWIVYILSNPSQNNFLLASSRSNR